MNTASPHASKTAQAGSSIDDLAIRFVNTAAWRLRSDVEERLPSPADLLAWLNHNGLLSQGQFKDLQIEWNKDADLARSQYGRAIALRELIYNLLSARIDAKVPADTDVEAFNDLLSGRSAGIAWRAGAYGWHVPSPQAADTGLLMPIALSAAELLTGIRANKVRRCQDDRGCGWLFVDESRTQNRRWCSMGDCGNRAKAHRHYERVKKGTRTSSAKGSN